jgi:N-formylmaleamate deformylase
MTEYTDDFVEAGGVKVHYCRTGKGDSTIILLHGASDNGLCWTPVAEMLAGRFDVIMPDAQGHGLSDRLTPDFNYTSHSEQIAALIRELGIEKPVIAGHSMGAGTTASVAVDYPDLPRAVILEDPGWHAVGSTDSDEKEMRDEFSRQFQRYSQMTREELIRECRRENPAWSDAEIGPWANSKLQFDTRLFSFPRQARSYADIVPRITCPALLITSDGGIVTEDVARHAVSLSKAETPLRWAKINGAGHNIRREQFDTYCGVVNSFLDSL